MIHESDEDPVIDFTWVYFIGMCKLRFSQKEVGRLTWAAFQKLYQHYKDDFDMELVMRSKGKTYAFFAAQASECEDAF